MQHLVQHLENGRVMKADNCFSATEAFWLVGSVLDKMICKDTETQSPYVHLRDLNSCFLIN